ncbi:hypothetical protein [Enterobacter roggenkampii]|uniref:hypothetical protein n=1 Tax=Enterobacter roggenkampii TaxID=1812935 RepID=UPI002075DC1A|nr:hypothetical protein [Enterobacter roggenkampii]MCM7083352.1 hypothetical protein [Enterobacter roggenkampii]
MQNLNRLNVPDVIATLKTGAEVNIGAANEADRKRLRYQAAKAGFKVAIAKLGVGYIASSTGKE